MSLRGSGPLITWYKAIFHRGPPLTNRVKCESPFNQDKALDGALDGTFSVIVQLCRLIVNSTTHNCAHHCGPCSHLTWRIDILMRSVHFVLISSLSALVRPVSVSSHHTPAPCATLIQLQMVSNFQRGFVTCLGHPQTWFGHPQTRRQKSTFSSCFS